MTTIVARNDPGASLLHDAHRATDDRAEASVQDVTRRSPALVVAPAAPPTDVLQMQPCQVQTRPAPTGPWELIQNLVAAVASSPGYCTTHVAGKPADLVPERVAMPLVAAKDAPPTPGPTILGPTVAASTTRSTQAAKVTTTSKPTGTASKAASSSTKKTSTAAKTSSSSTSSSGSSSVTAKELAFLSDKNLSIQDKLFRFVALMTKKGDQDLVDAMRSYETRRTASKSSSTSTSASSKSTAAGTIAPAIAAPPAGTKPPGGGGGGGLGSIFGGIGSAIGSVVDLAATGIGSLAKSVGGPLAAAAVTAVGLPELAPIASAAGGAVAGFVADQTVGRLKTGAGSSSTGTKASTSDAASGSTTKTSSSSGSAASASGDFDEQLEMMNLQRLVEKQTAMFAALSNVMKTIHDAQATAIQNIR